MSQITIAQAVEALKVTEHGGDSYNCGFLEGGEPTTIIDRVADFLSAASSLVAHGPEAFSAFVSCAKGADATVTLLNTIAHALLVARVMLEEQESARKTA